MRRSGRSEYPVTSVPFSNSLRCHEEACMIGLHQSETHTQAATRPILPCIVWSTTASSLRTRSPRFAAVSRSPCTPLGGAASTFPVQPCCPLVGSRPYHRVRDPPRAPAFLDMPDDAVVTDRVEQARTSGSCGSHIDPHHIAPGAGSSWVRSLLQVLADRVQERASQRVRWPRSTPTPRRACAVAGPAGGCVRGSPASPRLPPRAASGGG